MQRQCGFVHKRGGAIPPRDPIMEFEGLEQRYVCQILDASRSSVATMIGHDWAELNSQHVFLWGDDTIVFSILDENYHKRSDKGQTPKFSTL